MKEKFRCGECIHYLHHAHPARKSVCKNLEVKATAVAPRCYAPDVSQLVGSSEELAKLALMFEGLDTKQKRIVMAILQTPPRRRTFSLGTLLYFKAIGEDYISNYLSGYVLGYTSTKQVILCGSPDVRTSGSMYISYLEPESLMTHSEWVKHKAKLYREGRVVDPDASLVRNRVIDIDYEPPTLEAAPKKVYKTLQTRGRRNRTLVDEVHDITNGTIRIR